ncbi:MAG: hypothetical protein DRO08_04245 [Thermoprotei archaeon]|nr:MAG: hypothetical protein DRO08_04245 [Thermoprotei archaeon]
MVPSKVVLGALVVLAILGATIYVMCLPEVTIEETGLWLKPLYVYVEKEYEPVWISKASIGQYPLEAHVTGVPWISYNKSYCASTCLQMVAYKYSIKEPVEYFNFLMSFTYGASMEVFNSFAFFIPGSDPIPGFKQASKYLGLQYHFLVTSDKKLFLDMCKYLVSQDKPVVLPVDAGKLYNLTYPALHFVLLVGYRGEMFYIYEPVLGEEKFSLDEEGVEFSKEAILEAAGVFNEVFHLPWKYSLIYFTKAGEPVKNLAPLLRKNGELQVGFKYFIICTGAKAIETLANHTAQGKINLEEQMFGIYLAMVSRFDNAKFLKTRFSDNKLVVEAASKLEEAAKIYEQILELMRNGITPHEREQIVNLLFQAAKYEEDAGKLLIKASLHE